MNLEFKFLREAAIRHEAAEMIEMLKSNAMRYETTKGPISEVSKAVDFLMERFGPYGCDLSPSRLARRVTDRCCPQRDAIGFHGLA